MPIKRAKSKNSKQQSIFKALWSYRYSRQKEREFAILEDEISSVIDRISRRKLRRHVGRGLFWKSAIKFIPKKLIAKVVAFQDSNVRHRYLAEFLDECVKIHEGDNYIKKG